jgi:hypothetical protein
VARRTNSACIGLPSHPRNRMNIRLMLSGCRVQGHGPKLLIVSSVKVRYTSMFSAALLCFPLVCCSVLSPPAFILFCPAPQPAIYCISCLLLHPTSSCPVRCGRNSLYLDFYWQICSNRMIYANYIENMICPWETLPPRVTYATRSSEVCSARKIS